MPLLRLWAPIRHGLLPCSGYGEVSLTAVPRRGRARAQLVEGMSGCPLQVPVPCCPGLGRLVLLRAERRCCCKSTRWGRAVRVHTGVPFKKPGETETPGTAQGRPLLCLSAWSPRGKEGRAVTRFGSNLQRALTPLIPGPHSHAPPEAPPLSQVKQQGRQQEGVCPRSQSWSGPMGWRTRPAHEVPEGARAPEDTDKHHVS